MTSMLSKDGCFSTCFYRNVDLKVFVLFLSRLIEYIDDLKYLRQDWSNGIGVLCWIPFTDRLNESGIILKMFDVVVLWCKELWWENDP